MCSAANEGADTHKANAHNVVSFFIDRPSLMATGYRLEVICSKPRSNCTARLRDAN